MEDMEDKMKRILDIARKDLLQNLRDRSTFLFTLIMPVAFTLLFGLALGKGNKDTRLKLRYLDQDGGLLSSALKGQFQASKDLVLVEQTGQAREVLKKSVEDEKLAAAVIVPAGYSQSALAGKPLKILVIVDPASSTGITVQNSILTVTSRFLNAVQAAQLAAGDNSQPEVFEDLLNQALGAWQEPPVRLVVSQAGKPAGAAASPLDLSQVSPGMMAQFTMAGLLTATQLLVEERKSRTMQRLLTTSARRAEILLGHYLAIFALIFVQMLILIVFGQIVLKLDYLRLPWATLSLVLATAACIAALGLLIGALAKTDDQAIIFSMIPMFLFAGLGGAWVPLEMTGKAFQAVGHLTPVAWVMDGFKNIIARGLDFNSVILPVAALIGYAVLFFGVAAWKFRSE